MEFTDRNLGEIIKSNDECLTKIHDLIVCVRAFQANFSHLSFRVVPGVCNRAAKALVS
jgi:hypothetical protein